MNMSIFINLTTGGSICRQKVNRINVLLRRFYKIYEKD